MAKGPIYEVELLDTLPLGTGTMRQALPSRGDLNEVREVSERTVAGYEVLLAHYYRQRDEIERLQQELAAARAACKRHREIIDMLQDELDARREVGSE